MKTPIQACTSSVYIHSRIGVLKCWSVSKNFATAIRLLFVGHFVPDGVKKFALVAWREYVLPTGISYQGIAFYNPSLKCEALLWIRWKRAWKSCISVWNRARVLAVFFKFYVLLLVLFPGEDLYLLTNSIQLRGERHWLIPVSTCFKITTKGKKTFIYSNHNIDS